MISLFINTQTKFTIDAIMKKPFDRIFPSDFNYSGEAHDFWEIVYVIDGKIEVIENDEIYIMDKGNIIFHAPMEFHRIKSSDNTTPHVLNLSFKSSGELPEKIKNGVFLLDDKLRQEYLNYFYFIKGILDEENEVNQYDLQEAATRLSSIIFDICRNCENSNILFNTIPAKKYKKIVHQMDINVDNNYTISDFANENYLSVSYIKLLFQEFAGTTPKSYYNSLRIERAKRLLADNSVETVSEIMNFSSYNQFIRFFKKNIGITPLQFKKSSN